ncbi:hypothetical protein K503DRAFT_88217 [Rhizopogon vinicolor AM-OR11-026]|uniref:C2H2-type domain-containing protein n=1 Tax=Rhizopogon vinicolor AM-OR11-026 TaxID=1314800 RepID=A0A1B7NFK6_9AGAM|nr:hypothetical protein K503DRAFT_88217 [Rhizopogon vinicolor AM-OR11-026]
MPLVIYTVTLLFIYCGPATTNRDTALPLPPPHPRQLSISIHRGPLLRTRINHNPARYCRFPILKYLHSAMMNIISTIDDFAYADSDSVRYRDQEVNMQTELSHEAGPLPQAAEFQYHPTAMNISPTTNAYVFDAHDARNDIVQYSQEAGLAHQAGLEAWGSILGHPLHVPHIGHVGGYNTFNPHPIQSNRSKPLTILDRYIYIYPCQWLDGNELCNQMIQDDARQMLSHLKRHHGVQGGPKDVCCCLWQDCLRHVQHSSLARHLTTHLGTKIRCLNCSTEMARPDCARAHQKRKRVCSEATFKIIPGPNACMFA